MESIRKRLVAMSMVLLTVAQVSLLASADEEYYDYYDYDEDTYYTENEYSNDDSDDTTYNNSYLSGYSEQEDNSENSDILSVYETEAISADGADYILGDVTGDGKLSPIDSLIVLRYVCGRESLTELQKELGDFDKNGRVNTADALLIHRKSLGIDVDITNNTDTDKRTQPDTESEKDSEVVASDNEEDYNDDYSNGYGDNAEEDYSITVSGTKYSVPAGMTLYVTCDDYVDWGSTNTEIATVDDNGLILGKKPGKVNIIALEGDYKRTIEITVTPAEPVRTVYASPNSAAKGETVKLIATTDQTRTGVRFDVDIQGSVQSVYATEKTADNAHGIYTWVGYIKTNTAGSFDVTTYAEKNGSWSSCDNGETTMFVSSRTSASEVAKNTLRASDDVIRMISQYEGGLEEAEYDPIAYGDVMNYGYGVVIYAGDMFYNKASMSEYFADLVNQVNEKIYSRYVNEFLQENNIKYNQNQFDALVCFVYNLGVYALQNSGLKSALLNCYEPSATEQIDTNTATVSVDGYLNVRSGPGTNYSVIGKLYNGDKVTILDPNKQNEIWLKIETSSGLVGYCSCNYLVIGGTYTGGRNFNYIDKADLIDELLAYHHAGGQCYWGLVYRRIDELEMFFYADYVQDGWQNKHDWPLPGCILGY